MSHKRKLKKYIEFRKSFEDLNGRKYPIGVKFGVASEDGRFYYIENSQTKINKSDEGELYTIGAIVYMN